MPLPSDSDITKYFRISNSASVFQKDDSFCVYHEGNKYEIDEVSIDWQELIELSMNDGFSREQFFEYCSVGDASMLFFAFEEAGVFHSTSNWKVARDFHTYTSFGNFTLPTPPFKVTPPFFSVGTKNESYAYQLELKHSSSFERFLKERRSSRYFIRSSLDLNSMIGCLKAGTGYWGESQDHRSVPSAGGYYPVKLYSIAINISEHELALFEFNPDKDVLTKLSNQLPKNINDLFRTKEIQYDRSMFVVIMVGKLDSTCPKYADRGYRYILIESGHIGQNIMYSCHSRGLGFVPIGAVDDTLIRKTLCLQNDEFATYGIAVGRSFFE